MKLEKPSQEKKEKLDKYDERKFALRREVLEIALAEEMEETRKDSEEGYKPEYKPTKAEVDREIAGLKKTFSDPNNITADVRTRRGSDVFFYNLYDDDGELREGNIPLSKEVSAKLSETYKGILSLLRQETKIDDLKLSLQNAETSLRYAEKNFKEMRSEFIEILDEES